MNAQKEKRNTNINGKPKSTPETLNIDKIGKLIRIIATITTKTLNSRLFRIIILHFSGVCAENRCKPKMVGLIILLLIKAHKKSKANSPNNIEIRYRCCNCGSSINRSHNVPAKYKMTKILEKRVFMFCINL